MFGLTIRLFSDNNIGDDGARSLAECLKQHSSLTELNLGGTSKSSGFYGNDGIQRREVSMFGLTIRLFSDNNIGVDGARALAECLKQHSSLTELNLEGQIKWIL